MMRDIEVSMLHRFQEQEEQRIYIFSQPARLYRCARVVHTLVKPECSEREREITMLLPANKSDRICQ